MRRVHLERPFTKGMVTDVSPHNIGPQNSAFAQDLLAPNDLATQRKGWVYDGSVADSATNLKGVWRAKFVLADVTRTMTTDATKIYIHNSAGAGTKIEDWAECLPRAMYRDELLFCAQDGVTPMIRYSGAGAETSTVATADTINASAVVDATSGAWSASVGPGWFYRFENNTSMPYHIRVQEATTDKLTLEGIRWGGTTTFNNPVVQATALTTACVSVYNASTIDGVVGTGAVTGNGTKWSTGDWGSVQALQDVLLFETTNLWTARIVLTVVDDDTLTAGVPDLADVNYHILRPAPFKDVAAHKGSLWGTGVAQYPDRVYYSPPGWNPGFPPGFTEPLDPFFDEESSNPNDFLLDFIDVPSPFDGDTNVAILESPNPLLVLKRHGVYGIFGSYPTVGQSLIADGAGCIDIRSAWSFDFGQVWAGENGIFLYTDGRVIDLTEGRINREWRSLTDGFDFGVNDYCSIGEVSGHLVVHITTDGGTAHRGYVYDLRDGAWMSRLTNHKSRYFFSSKVPGEAERLLWVSDDEQGRVMNSAAAVNLTGIAKDGDGTSPRLQAWTGTNLGGNIDNLTRIADLQVHANVVDAGAAGSTQLAVSLVSGGGIGNPADATKILSDVNSDSVDRIDRHHRRVGRRGRFHQVRLDVDQLGTNTSATKIEVAGIAATVRDNRVRA